MTRQVAFIIFFFIAMGIFSYTCWRLWSFFRLTKSAFPINKIGKRLGITLAVAFGQTKILRRPIAGFMHALVWWGFIVITIGTAEMAIDGLAGTERIFASFSGWVYDIIVASGDVFAILIVLLCLVYLVRRNLMHIRRFYGVEIYQKNKADANVALLLILLLMVSLMGMNMGYLAEDGYYGTFPVSERMLPLLNDFTWAAAHTFHIANWWAHIGLVLLFLNILPYSKHFHVIMSVPNVFYSRLDSLTKMSNMPSVTKEVKLMLDPNTAFAAPAGGEAQAAPPRFGVKDIEDVSWHGYLNSLSCTQCGRCTDACPANITGKLLSPRKIMVDTRRRMNDKGPGLINNKSHDDGKALVGDYITREELWACTTCNACSLECPLNIDQPALILEMRRYLTMEESAMPSEWTMMMNNIENNGAPWQYAQSDRMKWAENIQLATAQ